MSQDKQFDIDLDRLTELVSKYTSIPGTRVASFLANYGVSKLSQCSYALANTEEQRKKLTSLFEFMRLYESLRYADDRQVLDSTENARQYFINFYIDKSDIEYFSAAFLDKKFNVNSLKILSFGSISKSAVYPREVMKEALFANAASVILCHNHTGYSERPSAEDLLSTWEIVTSLNNMDIVVNDHIIVAGQKAISFAERGIDLGYKSKHFKISEKDHQKSEPAHKKKSARTDYCR